MAIGLLSCLFSHSWADINVDLTNYSQLLFDKHGVVQTKVESIIFTGKVVKGINALLVSDNDGKPSEFYQVEIY